MVTQWPKEKLREIVQQYYYGDSYQWALELNEVRYDLDSSKICYSLIRHFKPTSCFEVGTSYGHSTVFITDALLKNQKETKEKFTFVGFEKEQDLYDNTCKRLTERHGKVVPKIYLGDFQEHLDKVPKVLDFAFIDTNHDRESTEWYIANILPRLQKGALVAIHDFAIEEIDDEWRGKGESGSAGLPETEVLMEHHKAGTLPLEPLYWNYKNPLFDSDNPAWEASFWLKV